MIKPHTLGRRIQAAREALGLSQADLAAKVGSHEKSVSRWENDKSEPPRKKRRLVAATLQVTDQWLLEGDHEVAHRAPVGDARPAIANAMAAVDAAVATLRALLEQHGLAGAGASTPAATELEAVGLGRDGSPAQSTKRTTG